MGYTPSFTPQYENGWEDLPSETSPITAEALNAYDDAIENIEEYLASDESQANLADAYDETATYEAGDYVIYGGDLYKCLEDIDEPEEWDSTKWKSCLITDEMATSGGTTVIANPSGQATETLTKLQVDETIYGVSGGGGNANIWTGTQAELEEVFDELEEGTQINITDDEQEVVEGGTIYSEDEQVIGLWTDNKPLYAIRKHYTVNKSANVTLDFTEGEAKVVDGYIINSLNGIKFPLNATWSSTTEKFLFDDTHFYVNTSSSIGDNSDLWLDVKYTKSTDAPLDAVVGKKTMYIASSDCYSTEEKEVGCAPNGKPLYQKTIIGTTLSGQTSDNKPHNISNLDEVIDAEVSCYFSSNGYWRKLNFAYNNGVIDNAWFAGFNINDTNIIFQVGNSFANGISKWYATIQYTKTTDTAGSGQYTPASGKAVHYSTDEQVIGTYVDGKPIYRKSFTYASGSLSTGSLTLANDLSNIARVIDKHCQFHGGSDNRDYDIPYFGLDYNESVFLLCHVLTDNTVTTALISNDHSSYGSMTDIVLTLEYTKTTD